MDESIGDEFANRDFGIGSNFLAQRLCELLILWKLIVNVRNGTLEPDGVSLHARLFSLRLNSICATVTL